MVVGINTHLFQVIVFSRYAQALLGVGNAGIIRLFIAQKVVFELVHARIGKQKGWIILIYNWRRRHNAVLF
ncbi:hypothetical protein ADICEAN_03283 [Cesiribacter andamanensis AMV16]|uniref:Uncharacterized protein n=1 Tax=Cesiribacter andamanensis AMV16 TaxID=1279009 RepID=M7MYP4_9BACT|nr:hypothetical protein ADICEAN_03283 [Cesiribacter andamanensis AMV16]